MEDFWKAPKVGWLPEETAMWLKGWNFQSESLDIWGEERGLGNWINCQ